MSDNTCREGSKCLCLEDSLTYVLGKGTDKWCVLKNTVINGLGNATDEDVLEGVTYSSNNGVNRTGSRPKELYIYEYNGQAFSDSEYKVPVKTSELKELFAKGAYIIQDSDRESLRKPLIFSIIDNIGVICFSNSYTTSALMEPMEYFRLARVKSIID